jgi:hypothetical protein
MSETIDFAESLTEQYISYKGISSFGVKEKGHIVIYVEKKQHIAVANQIIQALDRNDIEFKVAVVGIDWL